MSLNYFTKELMQARGIFRFDEDYQKPPHTHCTYVYLWERLNLLNANLSLTRIT